MPDSFHPFLAWAVLLACAATIAYAGRQLTRYADAIAEKTGWSRALAGMVLLGAVTSLPELSAGVSAVVVAQAPDIAVGNVLGACVLNLAYVALLDAMKRGEPLFQRASLAHIGMAGFGTVMLGIVAIGLLLSALGQRTAVGFVGASAPALAITYLVAVRMSYARERVPLASEAPVGVARYEGLALRAAVLGYAVNAVVVLLAGVALPVAASEVARVAGWHASFVGTTLVAGATALPELVVTISALRIGALDIAIANLLGSNLFNLLILAIDDLLWRPGPLLEAVSPAHAVSAVTAMLMSGIVVIALMMRPTGRVWHTASWASLALGTAYGLNAWVLFRFGG